MIRYYYVFAMVQEARVSCSLTIIPKLIKTKHEVIASFVEEKVKE